MKATKMKKKQTFFKVLTILQETTHTKAGVSHNFSLFFFLEFQTIDLQLYQEKKPYTGMFL